MRTWKQGVVGEIEISIGVKVFIKCLKYPLAVFYQSYNIDTSEFGGELFYAFLDLTVLKYINKINEIKLNEKEKQISKLFEMNYEAHKIKNDNSLVLLNEGMLLIEDIENRIITLGGLL